MARHISFCGEEKSVSFIGVSPLKQNVCALEVIVFLYRQGLYVAQAVLELKSLPPQHTGITGLAHHTWHRLSRQDPEAISKG